MKNYDKVFYYVYCLNFGKYKNFEKYIRMGFLVKRKSKVIIELKYFNIFLLFVVMRILRNLNKIRI